MRNISSYNDFTDKDQVMARWEELKRNAHSRHMNDVVRHLVKFSIKDVAFILCAIAWAAAGIYTLIKIWS